jgi:hypothetical protein
MSIEELSATGSPSCKEAFMFLREELKGCQNVEETIEYEPLKECEASSYNVSETPRVRVFFGEKLEVFLFIPERSVADIKADESIPEALRACIDRAQHGGMGRLLRIQLGSRKDVETLMPLVRAVIQS